ncbi:Uncharacterised protein [Aeromonas hydrophila]|nr:Uncharacterised protein [Aeromonas hydrophila]
MVAFLIANLYRKFIDKWDSTLKFNFRLKNQTALAGIYILQQSPCCL